MRNASYKVALVSAFCLAAASCTSSPRAVSGQTTPIYSRSELSYAMQNRDVKTVIYGNPFGTPQAELEKIVLDSMGRAPFLPEGVRFSTWPDDSANPHYRVVLAFNPTTDFAPWDMCKKIPDGNISWNGWNQYDRNLSDVTLQAAFCRDDALVSSATGYAPNVMGPYEQEFQSMIVTTSGSLFPTKTRFDNRCAAPNRKC